MMSNSRIQLMDVDRPGETMEAIVERATPSSMTLSVPNTIVRFELRRRSPAGPYEGALGGRWFVFAPEAETKKAG